MQHLKRMKGDSSERRMKNEDLKDPSNMEQEASEETASENTETSAEEKTTEKAHEKEGFFKKKKILRMKK